MAKAPKIIFWSVVALIGVAGLYLAYKKFFGTPDAKKLADELEKKAQRTGNPADKEDANQARITADLSTGISPDSFPLRNGSRGEYVKKLQQYIMKNHSDNSLAAHGADDGIFGQYTQKDVVKYISPDGIVTEQKYNSLIGASGSSPADAITKAKSGLIGKSIYASSDNTSIYEMDGKTLYKKFVKNSFIGLAAESAQSKSPNYNMIVLAGVPGAAAFANKTVAYYNVYTK